MHIIVSLADSFDIWYRILFDQCTSFRICDCLGAIYRLGEMYIYIVDLLMRFDMFRCWNFYRTCATMCTEIVPLWYLHIQCSQGLEDGVKWLKRANLYWYGHMLMPGHWKGEKISGTWIVSFFITAEWFSFCCWCHYSKVSTDLYLIVLHFNYS